MDYTIEIWTVFNGFHFAQCNCSWLGNANDSKLIEKMVMSHKKIHTNNGDSVEIV